MVLVEYLYVLLWNSGVAGVSLRLKLGVIRRFYAKKLPDNESSRPLFFLCVYGLSQWQHSVYQWNVWLMVWKCMVNPEKIRIEVTDQFGLNFSFKMIIYWFMQQNWCCFFSFLGQRGVQTFCLKQPWTYETINIDMIQPTKVRDLMTNMSINDYNLSWTTSNSRKNQLTPINLSLSNFPMPNISLSSFSSQLQMTKCCCHATECVPNLHAFMELKAQETNKKWWSFHICSMYGISTFTPNIAHM